MITDPVVLGVLVAAFTLTSLSSAWGLLRARGWAEAVSHTMHLVMSLVMVAMCWPWWTALPVGPQVVFFVAGAAWCCARLVVILRRRPLQGLSAWHEVAHLAMMLAMVWMIWVMARMLGGDGAAHVELSPGSLLVGVGLTGLMAVAAVTSVVDAVLPASRTVSVGGRSTSPAGRSSRGRLGLDPASGVLAVMLTGMAVMCWQMLGH